MATPRAVATPTWQTAADIYQAASDYARYNQKYNMTRQPLWQPEAARQLMERGKNLDKFIAGNKPGYRLQDWALYAASNANMVNGGFSINWPNRKGNSWRPLSETSQPQATIQPYKNYGKLETTAETASKLVTRIAHSFGADDVGFCILDRRWVYARWFDEETKKDYPIKFSDELGYEAYSEPTQLPDGTQVIPARMKYVIVMIHEMDYSGMATAPTFTQMGTTLVAYSQISYTLISVAEFIRALGYSAIPSSNDTALSIPLAIDAGLGELGRNAKLIHPRFGPRCRISKIITDLPLAINRPGLRGVTAFCTTCRKCAKHCPARAIPHGERSMEPLGDFNQRGVLQWQVDHFRCHDYWAKAATNCGICIRVCPFNKPNTFSHNAVRGLVRANSGFADSLLNKLDSIAGFGKFKHPDTYWNL